MKITFHALAFFFLASLCAAATTGNLKVTITPSAAVSAGARWRVDGGAWQSSGATVKSLTAGSHSVEFKLISGWIAPASLNATITTGSTTTLTANYVQAASIRVDLSPTTGQWRIAGGVWRASGTTATDVSPGNQTIEYSSLNGYAAPPAETVTLIAAQTLVLSRSYVQLAQVTLTLSPAAGQWRVDGGAWLPSGGTAVNVTAGSHTIDYLALSGYLSPGAETVTLVAGQSLILQRTYVQMAEIALTLVPATGQWRANGGAWQPSGARLWVPAGSYTIDYAPVELYDSPQAESVSLQSGQTFEGTRNYTSQKPTLGVNLTPTSGQWRLDGGAWQPSATVLTELSVGTHTIDYTDIGGDYAPLASETITLNLHDHITLSRSYRLRDAALVVTLNPSTGSWRAVGAITTGWQPSGATAVLAPGGYSLEYSALSGYDSPPTETVTLAPGQSLTLSRNYTGQPAQVTMALTPSSGQWQVYPILENPSGLWNASGATVGGLAPGVRYRLEYSDVPGYAKPDSPTAVDLGPGQQVSLSATYTPIPPRIQGALTPGAARFRINGGEWNLPDAYLTLPVPGDYLVEFSSVSDYETPPPQTVTLLWGDLHYLNVSYTPIAPGALTVFTAPTSGQFRVDGGGWLSSGVRYYPLSAGTHQVEFSPLTGYITPTPVTLSIAPAEEKTYTQSYERGPANLRITLENDIGLWRVDGGTWQGSGWLVPVGSGPHTIDYAPVDGYIAPAAENLVLDANETRDLLRAYLVSTASVSISLTPTSGQWRIYIGTTPGGTWNASGATVSSLSPGTYTIAYGAVSGYSTPPTETLVLAAGDARVLSRTYAPISAGYSEIVALPDLGLAAYVIRGHDGMVYGYTTQQGGNGGGTLFRISPDGTAFALLRSFPAYSYDGITASGLVDGSDGFLYGATLGGGSDVNKGVIFRASRDGTNYTLLRIFTNTAEGLAPANLLEASDGCLYGVTQSGANNSRGVIFKLNRDGTGYTVLKEFGLLGLEGRYATRLTEGTGGELFGAVQMGGSGSSGIVYRINKDGTGYAVVKTFAGGADGANPRAPLFRASDGYLYGTTSGGGTFTRGTAFRLNADGTSHVILRNFAGGTAEGSSPSSEFGEDATGTLFGATTGGGSGSRGTVFAMSRDGSTFVTLKHLDGSPSEGGSIQFAPILVSGGIINSVGRLGGAANDGMLFRLGTDGSGYSVVKDLSAPFGGLIFTSVIESRTGALVGTTRVGGANREGTVFKVNKDGTGLTVLRNFVGLRTAYAQGVIEASDGMLYGAASGSSGSEVYRLNIDGSGLTVVRSFANDGAPQGVIEGRDGVLYGTTGGGGATPSGAVFKINKDGSGYAILRAFGGGTGDGKFPYCGVIEGTDGVLYGTTDAGGAANLGTIYKLNRDGSGYAVLRQFAGGSTDGENPWNGVTYGTDGYLYGTTPNTPNNRGTVYRLRPDGSSYAVLHVFAGGLDGSDPSYSGIAERNGMLYGTTGSGGVFGRGTLYRMNPDGSGYEVLINFGSGSSDGGAPAATLLPSADGYLYGTTAYGGLGSVVFRFGPN